MSGTHEGSDHRDGVLDLDYAEARQTKRAPRYRLWRRTIEVCRALETYGPEPLSAVLDLGTADGVMLHTICEKFGGARCVGMELSPELARLAAKTFPELEIIQGDVDSLPFEDATFDAVTAAAVIEHVEEPGKVAAEAARVLKPKGVFVVTGPHPFWESIATRLGHLGKEQHHKVMDLEKMRALAEGAGLEVMEAERFMLSPVGMPFEFAVERVFRTLGLRFLMANQIMVARKGG